MKKFTLFFLLFIGLLSFTVIAEEENAIIVCDNSLEMFGWDLDFVREAKQSIEVSACYTGGKILRELLTEIEARLEVCPDLEVFLLATPVLLEKTDRERIAHLERTYPANFHLTYAQMVAEVALDIKAIDNHVKMLVVDEKYFSTGGTNLDDALCSVGTFTPPYPKKEGAVGGNLSAGVRDQDIVGRGPIAKELRETFHNLFALWENYNQTYRLEKNPDKFKDRNYYKPIDPSEQPFVESFESADALISLEAGQIEMIFGGPHQKSNKITKKYIELVKQAEEEIVIGNLYFCPEKAVFQTFLDALNRKVKLSLITNGVHENAPPLCPYFAWANRVTYAPLFYGRIFHLWESSKAQKLSVKPTHVYEYFVKDILYHKKVMIIDRRYFVIGSYNLGVKSDMCDYEVILVIDSPEVAEQALAVIEKDLEYSREVTAEQARKWYFDPLTAFLGESQKRYHSVI